MIMYVWLFALLCLVVFLISYIITVYMFYRLGRKFGIGSFMKFLIPVYNYMLLCDCAKISRWFAAGCVAPFFVFGCSTS